MRANVMGCPSMVTEADAPMSWSSRGNTDAGPAPRQTFTVGTSWRIAPGPAQFGEATKRAVVEGDGLVRRRRKALHPAQCLRIGFGCGCWLLTGGRRGRHSGSLQRSDPDVGS